MRGGGVWRRFTARNPYLNTQLGIAAVRRFQGDASFRDKRRVIATLKHFAAHGQPIETRVHALVMVHAAQ